MPIVTDQEVRFLSQEFIKWSIVYHDNSAMIPWGHTRPQTSFEGTVGVGTHRTGDRFCLISQSHMSWDPISASLHDADHGPLRELPAPATAEKRSLDPGGFSRYSKSDRLGKKQATHIFQTLQGSPHGPP